MPDSNPPTVVPPTATPPPTPPNNTLIYVGASVAVMLFGAIAALGIVIARPEQDNLLLIGAVFAFLTPVVGVMLALLQGAQNASAIQQVHVSVNSRMDQLLQLADSSARAEGKAVGIADTLQAGETQTAAGVVLPNGVDSAVAGEITGDVKIKPKAKK